MDHKIFTRKEFAEMVKVSEATLKRWDKIGTFRAARKPSGRPFYTEEHLATFFSKMTKK